MNTVDPHNFVVTGLTDEILRTQFELLGKAFDLFQSEPMTSKKAAWMVEYFNHVSVILQKTVQKQHASNE